MSRFNDFSTWPTKLGNPGSSMQLFTNESISLSVNDIESELQLSEEWLDVFVMRDYDEKSKRSEETLAGSCLVTVHLQGN